MKNKTTKNLYKYINSVVLKMKPFLTRLGVKSDAMSPFCRCFDSHAALLAVYQANMPHDIDDGPTAEPEENITPSNEVGIAGAVNIPSLTELVGILQDNATSDENLGDYNELQFEFLLIGFINNKVKYLTQYFFNII